MRRTAPNSPSFFQKPNSPQHTKEASLKRTLSVLPRKLTTDLTDQRKPSFKEFIFTRAFSNRVELENPPSLPQPSHTSVRSTSYMLELLLNKAKPTRAKVDPCNLKKAASCYSVASVEMVDQNKSADLQQLSQVQNDSVQTVVSRQLSDFALLVSIKSNSNSLSPTKVIRKVVGLPKSPFGKHSAYLSEKPFRKSHIIEIESAKWLNVHLSKRISHDHKSKAKSKP